MLTLLALLCLGIVLSINITSSERGDTILQYRGPVTDLERKMAPTKDSEPDIAILLLTIGSDGKERLTRTNYSEDCC
jgi:hypothetical protein